MKKSSVRSLSGVAIATLTALMGVMSPGRSWAVAFDQAEVDQTKFIAVAAPIGDGSTHQLLLIEQVSDKRPCWSESGSNPIVVDPLLSKFDFTGICGRSVDANGYSIRVGGQDMGLKYRLRIRQREGNMVLVGVPDNSGDQEVVLGSTGGMTRGFAKINLNSGWRLTKRSFNNKTLGHVYLTADSFESIGPTPIDTGGGTGGDLPFRDVAGDIYLADIREAVGLKFIKGFEDNTFRPQTALTREQIVSMILEALKTMPGSKISIPTEIEAAPYPDVEASRWSAAKIAYARDLKIVSGYKDGSFKPTQAVTRAELMALLKRASEYARMSQGQETTLTPTGTPIAFADIEGHWAKSIITEMSSYCQVASPLNEKGSNFAPNQSGLRNYAAAATLRMLDCVKPVAVQPPGPSAPGAPLLPPAGTPQPPVVDDEIESTTPNSKPAIMNGTPLPPPTVKPEPEDEIESTSPGR